MPWDQGFRRGQCEKHPLCQDPKPRKFSHEGQESVTEWIFHLFFGFFLIFADFLHFAYFVMILILKLKY